MEYDLGFLADTLVGPDKSDSDVIMGKIVSAQTNNTYTINLRGDTTAIAGVRSMVPLVANDVVWCLRKGSFILVVSHQDSGWLALTLQNGWVTYDGTDNPPPLYRKVNGIVFIKGLIKDGTTTVNTILANLPIGYRPAHNHHLPQWCSTGTWGMRVNGNNVVTPGDLVIVGANSATWSDISCRFVAEA